MAEDRAEQWFLSRGGSSVGPLSFEELRAQVHAGAVGATDVVWNASLGDWKPALEVQGLFPVSLFARTHSTYSDLAQLKSSGRIGENEFKEAVARLRLEDAAGVWWQVRAEDGAWLRWDGTAWVEGVPDEFLGAAATGGTHGAPAASPRSLGELGLLMLRGLGKSLPKKIALTVVVFVLVWLIHTVVMVFLNDGWAKVGNWFLGMILVVRGGELGGTFFWMLLMMLFTLLAARLRKGPGRFRDDLAGLSPNIARAFASPGRWGFTVMLGLAALTLLVSFLVLAVSAPYTPNRLLSLLFALLLMLSLSSGENSFVMLVSRLAWFDFQRLFGVAPIRPFQPEKIVLAVVGIAGGALLAAVLPFLPTSGWFGVLALVVAGAIMAALGGRRAPAGGFMVLAATLLAGAAALLAADQVLAHDWGWNESGRDLGRLMNSPGFVRAGAHSTAAGIGAVLGVLLPGVASGVAGGAAAAGPAVYAPLPPTHTLQGQDALNWLKRQGLVTQTPDGQWVKTGDWNNATASGSDMKGYVEGAQSTPDGVDPDMVILVEGGPGPAPPQAPGPDDAGGTPPYGADDADAASGPEEGDGGTAPETDKTPKRSDGKAEGPPDEGAQPPDEPEVPESGDGSDGGEGPEEGGSEDGTGPEEGEPPTEPAPAGPTESDKSNLEKLESGHGEVKKRFEEAKDRYEEFKKRTGYKNKKVDDALNKSGEYIKELGEWIETGRNLEEAYEIIRGFEQSHEEFLKDARGRYTHEAEAEVEAFIKSGGQATKAVIKVLEAKGVPVPEWLSKDIETTINLGAEGVGKTLENAQKLKRETNAAELELLGSEEEKRAAEQFQNEIERIRREAAEERKRARREGPATTGDKVMSWIDYILGKKRPRDPNIYIYD